MKKCLNILWILFLLAGPLAGQEDPPGQQPKGESSGFELNEKKWERLRKNKDYTERAREPKDRKQREKRSLGDFFDWFLGAWKIIAYVLVALILAYILYRLLKGTFGYFQEKADKNITYSLEDIEENIDEADLHYLLQKAIQDKNFKLALRIHFLIIIKLLKDKNLIHWKKDKTNWSYVNELSGKKEQTGFITATNSFERVWYGDLDIDMEVYNKISKPINQYIQKLETNES